MRGRAGVAFDRVLPYVTGGWAYGYHRTHGTLTAINTVGAPIESAFSSSKFMSGWTIGGGVEWAFADHWSAKFEYLYIDFGRLDNINLALAGAPFTLTNGNLTENIVRVGVNYRFR